MNLKQCYAILEIEETASIEEIKQAYRDLIAIWHPDRHARNPRLQEKATEKLKALNTAYDSLVAYHQRRTTTVDSGATDKSGGLHMLVCPSCGASNQVRFHQLKLDPKCGKCGSSLLGGGRKRASSNGFAGTGATGGGRRRGETAGGSGVEANRPFTGRRPKSKRRIVFTWMLILLAMGLASLKLFSEWSEKNLFNQLNFLMGTGQQSEMVEKTPDQILGAVQIDTQRMIDFQRSLLRLGYDIGPADGKMGSRTIAAAQRFASEFHIELGSDFVEDLISQAARQVSIAGYHLDWPDIAYAPDFDIWIENQTLSSPESCRKIRESGSLQQVVNMVNAYKFDRIQPEPEQLPSNGILKKRFYKGMAPLKIRARNENRNYYIKLVAIPDHKEILTAFLRSGGMLTAHVPLGKYELKYAVGSSWYGPKWLFGNKTVFSRLDRVFDFNLEQNEISGYSIELYIKPVALSGARRDYIFDF